MIVYLIFGFLFLAVVLYVVYRLARMSGGTVNQNAAPAAPRYDWQSVLGRTVERVAMRAADEYFEDDAPPKAESTSRTDGSGFGIGELTIEKFGPGS
jgi:hypothetical protein